MSTSSTRAGNRRSGRKTRERILEAAEEVFVRFGYEGARMDQIAEVAGVRKANIYYYFDGKEQLYRALVERILEVLIEDIRTYLSRQGETPWELLDGFLEMLFDLVRKYQGLVGLAYGELLHPPREEHGGPAIGPVLTQVEQMGIEMIEDGIREGHFREVDPRQTVISLQGLIFEYFMFPEERVQNLLGRSKFDPEALAARREHLRELVRRVLER